MPVDFFLLVSCVKLVRVRSANKPSKIKIKKNLRKKMNNKYINSFRVDFSDANSVRIVGQMYHVDFKQTLTNGVDGKDLFALF